MPVYNAAVYDPNVYDTGTNAQTVTCAGIASAEAFGAARVFFLVIYPAGIASAGAFGTASAGGVHIIPVGILSAEAFADSFFVGEPGPKTVTVVGIVSKEKFGTAGQVAGIGGVAYGIAGVVLICGDPLKSELCPSSEC